MMQVMILSQLWEIGDIVKVVEAWEAQNACSFHYFSGSSEHDDRDLFICRRSRTITPEASISGRAHLSQAVTS